MLNSAAFEEKKKKHEIFSFPGGKEGGRLRDGAPRRDGGSGPELVPGSCLSAADAAAAAAHLAPEALKTSVFPPSSSLQSPQPAHLQRGSVRAPVGPQHPERHGPGLPAGPAHLHRPEHRGLAHQRSRKQVSLT